MPSVFEATAGTALGVSSDQTGSVTQATSKATGVTLSKVAGVITMDDAALAAAAEVSFAVTNTNVLQVMLLLLIMQALVQQAHI